MDIKKYVINFDNKNRNATKFNLYSKKKKTVSPT